MKKIKRISLVAAVLALIPLLILSCRIYRNQQKTDSFRITAKWNSISAGFQ